MSVGELPLLGPRRAALLGPRRAVLHVRRAHRRWLTLTCTHTRTILPAAESLPSGTSAFGQNHPQRPGQVSKLPTISSMARRPAAAALGAQCSPPLAAWLSALSDAGSLYASLGSDGSGPDGLCAHWCVARSGAVGLGVWTALTKVYLIYMGPRASAPRLNSELQSSCETVCKGDRLKRTF